jgi:hypothetical protein
VEQITFLGLRAGWPEPINEDVDRPHRISNRQMLALLQITEAARKAGPGAIAATPLLSWLVGFEAGTQLSPLALVPQVSKGMAEAQPSPSPQKAADRCRPPLIEPTALQGLPASSVPHHSSPLSEIEHPLTAISDEG